MGFENQERAKGGGAEKVETNRETETGKMPDAAEAIKTITGKGMASLAAVKDSIKTPAAETAANTKEQKENPNEVPNLHTQLDVICALGRKLHDEAPAGKTQEAWDAYIQ